MAERTTKSQIVGLFEHFAHAMGRRIARSYNDVGAWRLDYVPEYGGWNIEEIATESGAVRQPFGSRRYRSGEFWELLRFGLMVADDLRGRRARRR